MMRLSDIKTHSPLLLADVTNLLPTKGQYFKKYKSNTEKYLDFIIMLVFQGAFSLIHQLQAANNPSKSMYVSIPQSLISASWWCLDKRNSRLLFTIQPLVVLIQASKKIHSESRACNVMV